MVKNQSALRKNTLREIFKSPGRYLAILGIIMLGAGFFAGVSVFLTAIFSMTNPSSASLIDQNPNDTLVLSGLCR